MGLINTSCVAECEGQTDALCIVARRTFSSLSPLRYPGGKAKLAGFLSKILDSDGGIRRYVEPYAGGAGAGIALLSSGQVNELHINDLDPAVYSFWKLFKNNVDRLVSFIENVPLDVEQWNYQRTIYREALCPSPELGLAFFYLNRTNRSGILNAGVIGGKKQTGNYKMDARFNRGALVKRVTDLIPHLDQMLVTNKDGRDIISAYGNDESTLLYIDPPYVQAGSRLYLNAFDGYDHMSLANVIHEYPEGRWVITYDNHPLVRDLYRNDYCVPLSITYSAHKKTTAQELLITSRYLADKIAIINKVAGM
ncbi:MULTISPECIES: DNA adenine methylase [Actinotignum]|uniref:site-specific DNA-methyltransferase (adenine-specific) n=1 Tax=Actinotignum timonense TaxID=1870995 RepID=A0AAW9HGC8_9ACTO|nr:MULTISPECIES: DNA adenine methylase [Actinotignum]MDE1557871.1 DNA adenine methylase [Actinotignum schaalii]MDE1663250.1 DNA adenine methylase [Actinotignum schaalii]MDK6373516.1 DNA adenine methylase [Actinotignum timonense]MDK6418877.1 DNA adenine methylase [Actinotignum timonense]MDK6590949.1 DNA adenine methylase [Actinotignum timonense]